MEYPNIFYKQLADRVIQNTSLKLKKGEVCFYEGPAKSFKITVTEKKGKTKNKPGFFWTPWFWGISNKKTTEVITETRQNYYGGYLYITNMRVVFNCKVDAFDVMIPKIKRVKQYNDGIQVVVGRKKYIVLTGEVREVLYVFDLINRAQDPKNNTPACKVSDFVYQNNYSRTANTYTRTENTRPPIDEAMARVLKNYLITNPGVIQSELYKQLPQYDKDEISNALYWWEKDGKIRREKSGRSYAVYSVQL